MTEYRQGYLHGKSEKATSPQELLGGTYDLALLSSSWDKRCLSITECDSLRVDKTLLVLFDARDDWGYRLEHDSRLKDYALAVSKSSEVITGDSHEIQIVWRKVMSHVLDTYEHAGRPLRILVDLSSCPRYLSIGLACDSLQSGLASDVSVFYAEGAYPEETSEHLRHELFTVGGWDAIPIPSLSGEWSPDKDRSYLVSVGFEGSKTLRLVSRAEPDAVQILFPDPGVKVEYVRRTTENNATLLARLRDKERDLICAHAGDAIEAFKQLDKVSIEDQESSNYYYACCGTKPHSLALALRASVLRYPAVLYIVPDRHKVVEVSPLGVYWRFDLHDVTSLGDHIDG